MLDVAIGGVVFAVMQYVASRSVGDHVPVIMILPMLGITFLICAANSSRPGSDGLLNSFVVKRHIPTESPTA